MLYLLFLVFFSFVRLGIIHEKTDKRDDRHRLDSRANGLFLRHFFFHSWFREETWYIAAPHHEGSDTGFSFSISSLLLTERILKVTNNFGNRGRCCKLFMNMFFFFFFIPSIQGFWKCVVYLWEFLEWMIMMEGSERPWVIGRWKRESRLYLFASFGCMFWVFSLLSGPILFYLNLRDEAMCVREIEGNKH